MISKVHNMKKADFAIIGLAVMGENLALNVERNGYTVAVYNRTSSKTESFIDGRGKGKAFIGCRTLEELSDALEKPRKIMLMIKQGAPVDDMIEKLVPLLDQGDVIIDGGNSNYQDTVRRYHELSGKGIYYLGMGVSGGEEGALNGPSLMPGGSRDGFDICSDILMAVSAKTPGGQPCCGYIGPDGAGHFVKMVHNGIEYGDMEIISEAYSILKNAGYSALEMHGIFDRWNRGKLSSYLIEITAGILDVREDGELVLDHILDTAGQKGTGKWTSINALDEGEPLNLISEAVFMRYISSQRALREKAGRIFGSDITGIGDREDIVERLENTVYLAKMISYAQGFSLIKRASEKNGWNIDLGKLALLWREGCIIRSVFLEDISRAYEKEPELENLLFSERFAERVSKCLDDARNVVSEAIKAGIPVPAMSSALSYFDSLRSTSLHTNMIQAQRDFFGAHMYERTDRERGEFYHTNWTGKGGDTASTVYNEG